MGIGATAVAALLAILERPMTWLFGLVGFLVRGGWLIVLAPIIVLPSAVGLANVVAPLVEDIAFGRRTDEVMAAASIVLIIAVAWLIGGGLLAAAAEVEGVRQTLPGLGAIADRAPRAHPVWRVFAVRCLTLIPLVVALAWSSVRIVTVGYRELTVPSDVTTPISLRIVTGAPDAVILTLLAWLFAEIVGSVAARRIVLEGDGVGAALRRGMRDLRRDVARLVLLALLSSAVLLVSIAATGLATGTTWDALRATLADRGSSPGAAILLLAFVALFGAGLVILGLVTAWRSALWTALVAERVGPSAGTFGGGADTRSGD